jgi:MFS family permease
LTREADARGPTTAQEWRSGWRTVLAAAIGAATGLILYSYIVSLFIRHHVAEFGWTRGETAMASMATLAAGVLSPLVGRLADRLGVRPVIIIGALGFAAATVGLSLQTGDIRVYYGLVFVLVFFGLGTTSITWTRTVSACFDRSRGLALSVTLSGVVITAALAPQLLTSIIETYGWRAGWLGVGAIAIVGSGVGLMLLPSASARRKVRPGETSRLGDAVRSPAFWCLVLGMFLINIPSGGLMNQMAALISDKGFSPRETASVMSAFAISVALGRLVAGLCLDRLPTPLVAFASMIVPAAGCLMLLGDGAVLWAVIAGIVCAGMSQGAEGDIGPYIVSRYFGLGAFGAIMGSVNAGVVTGTAAGGMLFGRIHDLYGNYDVALWIGAGCFLAGAFLFLGLAWRARRKAVIQPA